MSKIKIMTDSAGDISSEDEKKYSIGVIPFSVMLGDKTYISRVDFNNEQFFGLMAQYDEIPKTSQITAYQFADISAGGKVRRYGADFSADQLHGVFYIREFRTGHRLVL